MLMWSRTSSSRRCGHNMRTILVYPRRGNPPPVPEGYEAEPGDPFVHHMKWAPCKHRGTLDCGGCPSNKSKSGPPYCELLDIIVDQNTCKSCKERVE